MKQIAFRYGLYATLLIVGVSAFNLLVLVKITGNTGQEVAGYLAMLLAMVFVFLGMRRYRDQVNGGYLSFGEGMRLGLLIASIPAVFFGLFDLLYTEVINPGWLDDYYHQYIERIRATTEPARLEAELAKAAKEKEFFSNPVMQFLVMGATVFIIGVIVTIISALTLRRSKARIA